MRSTAVNYECLAFRILASLATPVLFLCAARYTQTIGYNLDDE